jgi:hypothetical protein
VHLNASSRMKGRKIACISRRSLDLDTQEIDKGSLDVDFLKGPTYHDFDPRGGRKGENLKLKTKHKRTYPRLTHESRRPNSLHLPKFI